MHTFLTLLAFTLVPLHWAAADAAKADHRSGPLKDLNGDFSFTPPATRGEWDARAAVVRRGATNTGTRQLRAIRVGSSPTSWAELSGVTSRQSVVSVMEAARRVGLTQITFATQSSAAARSPSR